MMKAKLFLKKIQLRNKQREVNKKYAKEGLTDEVFNAQLEINKMRHKHNISDSSKSIFENFVQ